MGSTTTWEVRKDLCRGVTARYIVQWPFRMIRKTINNQIKSKDWMKLKGTCPFLQKDMTWYSQQATQRETRNEMKIFDNQNEHKFKAAIKYHKISWTILRHILSRLPQITTYLQIYESRFQDGGTLPSSMCKAIYHQMHTKRTCKIASSIQLRSSRIWDPL